jgi:hypothetical protein
VFYVGGLGKDIRHHLRHLSWMQKDRDNKVNSMDSVNGKKRSLCVNQALYDEYHVFLLR